METKKKLKVSQRVLVTLAFYLSVILISLILAITHQITGWVAQTVIALSLGRLVFLFGWVIGKMGKGWRV